MYIDNNVFKLHYKVTVSMLTIFIILVAIKQYIEDPIDCIVDGIPQEVMDAYCWIHSTFTISNELGHRIGKDIISPGVSAHTGNDEVKYHQYYQWVCIMLLIQAVLFYIPHYLWKNWEAGRMKMISLGMERSLIDEKYKENRKIAISNYYMEHKGSHNMYFWKFFLCEILNFINVLGQIFLLNSFLGGEFLSYGHQVFQYMISKKSNGMVDPMSSVFPKITKCTFQKYGPSGGMEKFDGLCILPVNILNEKIYTIVWFWFIFLAAISGLSLIFRLLVITCPWTRTLSLPFGFSRFYKDEFNSVTSEGYIGDWFILLQLSKNMDSLMFCELIKYLSEKIDNENNYIRIS